MFFISTFLDLIFPGSQIPRPGLDQLSVCLEPPWSFHVGLGDVSVVETVERSQSAASADSVRLCAG